MSKNARREKQKDENRVVVVKIAAHRPPGKSHGFAHFVVRLGRFFLGWSGNLVKGRSAAEPFSTRGAARKAAKQRN